MTESTALDVREPPWTQLAPPAWRRTYLGHVVDVRSGATPSDEPSFWNGSIPWISPKDMKVFRIFDAEDHVSEAAIVNSSLRWIPAGSVLMVTRGMILDRTVPIALAMRALTINQDMKALVPHAEVHSEFLAWLLLGLNHELLARVEEAAHGAKALRTEQWKSLLVALPPWDFQLRIAHFLARRTQAIDRVIETKQRLLELLAEKRQALIVQAVTQGLNRRVRTKQSNIPWIDQIPEHWTVQRIRFLYRERNEVPLDGDGIVTAFRDGQVALRERRRADGFMLADKEVGYQHVCAGDVVVHSMDAFAGAIGVAEDDGKCTPEYVVLVPSVEGADNGYFARLLRVMAQRDFIFVMCPSVRERAPRIRFVTLRDMFVPVPPASEQNSIAEVVGKVHTQTQRAMESLRTSVAKLGEYRQALITAAVTGKIDVTKAETPKQKKRAAEQMELELA